MIRWVKTMSFIDIDSEIAIAADADALIDQVADKLLAGQISQTLRNENRRHAWPLINGA